MISESDIRKMEQRCGIPMMGVIDATPLTDFEAKCEERAFTPFCHIEPQARIDFQQAFPQAKSVVVIGLPYSLRKVERSDEVVHIASFCEERDYHLRVKEKLEGLVQALLQIQSFDYRIFVDQAQLIDRASAWKAGLGFFGKNNCLIHPTYGSAFVIGQLLLSIPIDHEPVVPMTSRCGDCEKCLKACPNSALGDGFDLEANRCISYLTQKKKLREEENGLFNTYLYGCDFCQLVCPYNQIFFQEKDDNKDDIKLIWEVKFIREMKKVDFKKNFGKSPLFWRGLEIIQRNAQILATKK